MINKTNKKKMTRKSYTLKGAVGLIALFAIVSSAVTIVRAQELPTVALSDVASQTVTVGDTVTFTATATDSDASGTIAYSLSGTVPSGASIDPSAGTFSWDTTGAAPNTYPFSVVATGSTGGSDSKDVSITVNAPPSATSTDTGGTASTTNDTGNTASTTSDTGSTASSTPALDTQPQTQVATSTDGTGGTATTTGGTINTGDATATTSINNALNSNDAEPDSPGGSNNSNITASTTNDGSLDSAATSTADTGSNTVTGGSGDNTIVTGNAVSTANVINEVNTNIFNSQGLVLFLNQLFGGGINLNDYDLSYFFAGGPGNSPTAVANSTPQCTLLTCLTNSNLNVYNTNNATVTNSVIVRSSTGSNVASSSGNASVNTGNAYAAANVLNLVNTNVINSSYLLLSFNNFGNLNDDITLPDDTFFSNLFANGGQEPALNDSNYNVNNTNSATTTGAVTADANTGGNMASTSTDLATTTEDASTTPTTGNGVVTTGSAYSSASSFNQENTNSVGGTSVFMLFRVSGNWSGTVKNLPAGMTWATTTDGIEVVSTNSAPPAGVLGEFNNSNFLASSTNTAALNNNVSVSADTGGNTATTGTGTSTVNTGNAYSVANVVNLVNTDIVGQNWIFAVFNIFGNWDGNIDFGGSPNLSIAAQPSVNTAAPGSDVVYTFAVTNTGTGDASDAVLNASFDNKLLSFDQGGAQSATPTANGESWDLGVIPRDGQPHTFSFTAHVATNFSFAGGASQATVPLSAAVVNNSITSPSASTATDTSIVVTAPPAPSGGGGGGGGGGGIVSSNTSSYLSAYTPDPNITITKTVNIATSTATTSVGYQVVVDNDKAAGPAYGAVLTDTLTDPQGNTMYTRSWNLDTINPGDDITLTYSVVYSATSTPGVYTNVAEVTGLKNYSDAASGNPMTPVEAEGDVMFSDGHVSTASTTTGLVLGVATSTPSCAPLLTGFIKPGAANNPADVFKLQVFLNTQGADLSATGRYDTTTIAAVNQFQVAHATTVLAPWGLKNPTGVVFTTTQRTINTIACSDQPPFALTPQQLTQLASIGAGTLTHTTTPHAAASPSPKASAPAPQAPAASQSAAADIPVIQMQEADASASHDPIHKITGWFSSLFSWR